MKGHRTLVIAVCAVGAGVEACAWADDEPVRQAGSGFSQELSPLDDVAANLLGGNADDWIAAAAEINDAEGIEPHVAQRAARQDLSDRRGLEARAQFCDRRVSLSASEPVSEGGRPRPVPSPGPMALVLSAAGALLYRRRTGETA
jgi:hypothetical protein